MHDFYVGPEWGGLVIDLIDYPTAWPIYESAARLFCVLEFRALDICDPRHPFRRYWVL